MNDRIQLILKTKNISASKFADEIGVQRSSISHIISGRNNPSLDFIQKIIKRFPDINSDWMIFGKGTMYKEQDLFSTVDYNKNEKSRNDVQISNSQDDIFNENNDEFAVNQVKKMNNHENEGIFTETVKKAKTITETIKELKKPSNEIKIQSRKIERIIIFYSDKTCTEYQIEQNN